VKVRLIIALIVTFCVIYFVLANKKTYHTVSPERKEIIRAVYGNGIVRPVYYTKIPSLMTGTISKINHEAGDIIKKDETIAQIDDLIAREELHKLKARVDYVKKY
jgi:multidrug efflux pump subunit AcrA (membrane-fusion protein)